MLKPIIRKNDRKARILIIIFSLIIFVTITALSQVVVDVNLPFDVHYFAFTNSVINSIVSVLLIAALFFVKRDKYIIHRNLMMTAMVLSVLFLLSYIGHHLFAGETKFGDSDHDGLVSEAEKAAVGSVRYLYYFLLLTHIPLAAVILPMVLFTSYRALAGEYERHKKLARIAWPVWFYVAVSGVAVYWMIQPYYI